MRCRWLITQDRSITPRFRSWTQVRGAGCPVDIRSARTGAETCDLVYLPAPKYPDKPALLIELKYDKTIKTAADQIREKNYPQKLEHYKDNILLISINYDKDASSKDVLYKHHSCSIEKA